MSTSVRSNGLASLQISTKAKSVELNDRVFGYRSGRTETGQSHFIDTFSASGKRLNTFAVPAPSGAVGLACTETGRLLWSTRIDGGFGVIRYTSEGQYLGVFVQSNYALGELATDQAGNLYARQAGTGLTRKFAADGRFLLGFYAGSAITIDHYGNLYGTVDYGWGPNGVHEIRKYSPTGKDLGAVVTSVGGGYQGGFGNLAIDSQGNIFAQAFDASKTRPQICKYSPSGERLPFDIPFSCLYAPLGITPGDVLIASQLVGEDGALLPGIHRFSTEGKDLGVMLNLEAAGYYKNYGGLTVAPYTSGSGEA